MIKLKQIELPPGTETTAVEDGQVLDGTEAAELIAGVDETGAAQFIATEPDGRVIVSISDGGSLTVDGSVSVENFPAVQAVDVQGTVPITGMVSVSNLGHAEDTAAISGDTGLAVLGVYQPDTVGVSATAPGTYATLNVDDKGRLRVSPGGVVILDTFDSLEGITGTSTDVTNIQPSTNHVRGTGAVSFDIVDTPANNPFALIQKTIPPVNLAQLATGITFVQLLAFIPNVSNVNNVVIRLGTDASNYNSWSISVANGTAVGGVWQSFRAALGTCNASVGLGWDLSAITYYAVGLEMSTANNTLNGVVVDSLWAIGGQVHGSDTTSEISSVISTAKIDVAKMAGRAIDVDLGASTTATQRVIVASNDPNLQGINQKLTDGSQKSIARGGTKGSTTAADVTSTASGANHQVLDVAIYDAAGNQITSFGSAGSPTSTLVAVAASVSSVQLLASNAARRGATVENDSTAALYLSLGATASQASRTIKMAPASYYETPFGYTGVLSGAWASADGFARCTEVS